LILRQQVSLMRISIFVRHYDATARQLTCAQLPPLYPALYPPTKFQSQNLSAVAKGKSWKTLKRIERSSDCTSAPKTAKTPYFD